MTIEIRELVIKAEIDDAKYTARKKLPTHIDKMKDDESRLIEIISKQVLEIIRMERGRGI
ncbi:DUF5908 family protein [Aeromonas sp. SG16]|uniref:DUF5908 family protein n=1 Tax=Aeromonas sp. SG16 TaxID=2950548 RepID=UPI00210A4BF4|nr:DUF5908 family protein [Aeromonas sp. SG16]MCQ4054440.1 DUF5908 family protein [Aeromonas sp. SG16]